MNTQNITNTSNAPGQSNSLDTISSRNFVLDTHTHTIASGHAYSTLQEMLTAAKEKRLELLCITEHAPAMPGSCHLFYFHNYRVVKNKDWGIPLLLGAELNILNFKGKLDMEQKTMEDLDICIASIHNPCMQIGSAKENTNAYIHAMKNPMVDIIGHPDDGRIPIEYERLVEAAKQYGVALEVNNSSLSPSAFRVNARENAKVYLSLCKEYEVPISVGSDAHICNDIGSFAYVNQVLDEVGFPDDLILNTSVDRLYAHLNRNR